MNHCKEHLMKLLSNGTVEVRCLDKASEMAQRKGQVVIWSGQYDNYDDLRSALIDGEKRGFDVYTTINPTKIPATNLELKPFKRTTRDADIQSIRTIFFDFDPEREVGLPATDDQIDLAMEQAYKLIDFLKDEGWGEPTVGFSGNGAHVIYYTVIAAEHQKAFVGLYSALDKRFSTDEISFDVTVKNLSRIARCLGTTNRKASRRSSCVYSNDSVAGKIVLETCKKLTPPKKPIKTWVKNENQVKEGGYINGAALFNRVMRSGLVIDQVENGKWYVTCPNHAAHGHTGKTDSVMWWNGQFITYHCSHSHCADLDARWLDGVL